MIDPEKLVQEWTWKTEAMREMTMAVCRLVLARSEFSALDLPTHGEKGHGGSGIAGSVFGSLAKAEIIEPVGSYATDGEFFQRRVRNPCGNPIGVWRGGQKRHLAGALLRRHGGEAARPAVQMSLFGG